MGGGARVVLPVDYMDGADSGALPDAAAERDASSQMTGRKTKTHTKEGVLCERTWGGGTACA